MTSLTKRILFTTTYITDGNFYDPFRKNIPLVTRPIHRRTLSYGLRFIKYNLPEIEILEYPSWQEYEQKRIEHFAKWGWKCIVIWEDEINSFAKKLEGVELW